LFYAVTSFPGKYSKSLVLLNQYAGNDKWGGRNQDPRGSPTHQNMEGSKQLLARILYLPAEERLLSMEACAEHVQYQFPCPHSRVGFLLDATQSNDAGLQAAQCCVTFDVAMLKKLESC
jgi:hypothetical protein